MTNLERPFSRCDACKQLEFDELLRPGIGQLMSTNGSTFDDANAILRFTEFVVRTSCRRLPVLVPGAKFFWILTDFDVVATRCCKWLNGKIELSSDVDDKVSCGDDACVAVNRV